MSIVDIAYDSLVKRQPTIQLFDHAVHHHYISVINGEEDPTSRVWNVALQHPTKGEHAVQWTYGIASEHIEDAWNLIVTDEISFND